jgi:hypothetical protein
MKLYDDYRYEYQVRSTSMDNPGAWEHVRTVSDPNSETGITLTYRRARVPYHADCECCKSHRVHALSYHWGLLAAYAYDLIVDVISEDTRLWIKGLEPYERRAIYDRLIVNAQHDQNEWEHFPHDFADNLNRAGDRHWLDCALVWFELYGMED